MNKGESKTWPDWKRFFNEKNENNHRVGYVTANNYLNINKNRNDYLIKKNTYKN